MAADTNVVLRYLLREPEALYLRAHRLMARVSAGEIQLRLSALVIAEAAAVLHHTYGRSQAAVAGALLALATARGVQLEEEQVVVAALERSRDLRHVDFVDAYLAEKVRAEGIAVATFDRSLAKQLGATAFDL